MDRLRIKDWCLSSKDHLSRNRFFFESIWSLPLCLNIGPGAEEDSNLYFIHVTNNPDIGDQPGKAILVKRRFEVQELVDVLNRHIRQLEEASVSFPFPDQFIDDALAQYFSWEHESGQSGLLLDDYVAKLWTHAPVADWFDLVHRPL
jgi:hypothetical protein